jgi:hypothetical protein
MIDAQALFVKMNVWMTVLYCTFIRISDLIIISICGNFLNVQRTQTFWKILLKCSYILHFSITASWSNL